MTIVISGEIDLKPEAREDALLGAQPLLVAARAEKGCVHYAWTADPALPGRVHVFEEWAAEADLAAHLKGAPYLGMLAHLGAAGLLHAVTRKYRVDLIEPVYDPEGRPRADFFTRA
ncbi:MAG: antibiotic biosynthesis monooxygenase [Caulobacteraceae bacterium]